MLQLQDEEELLVVDAFDHVQSFVAQAKRAATLADLNTLLGEVGTSLGLDYYALAHHVDLGRPPSSSVLVSNYPIGWFHTILRQRYFVDDPIFAAAQHASAGFLWEDIGALIQLSDRQKRIFATAGRQGIGPGFTVPITLRGEPSASCSFAVKLGRRFPPGLAAVAQSIGWFAFEAARRLAIAQGGRPRRRVAPLTSRQLDCVVLIAKGKSDGIIGELLGLSRHTVNHYVEDAKRRHGVATRQQLLISALWEGQVTFEDMFG